MEGSRNTLPSLRCAPPGRGDACLPGLVCVVPRRHSHSLVVGTIISQVPLAK